MPDTHQLGISTVMTGETFHQTTDELGVAAFDAILLGSYLNGEAYGGFLLRPEEAVQLAQGLMRAAGILINEEIDDNGRPLSPAAKMARYAKLFRTPAAPDAPEACQ